MHIVPYEDIQLYNGHALRGWGDDRTVNIQDGN
jgi:hypothetical protein